MSDILLVEDNPSDIGLAQRVFAGSRTINRLIVAEDGEKALDYLLGRGAYAHCVPPLPALVLLDLKLPGLPGLEVLRQIREHPRSRRVPVVILTNSSEDRDMASGYDLGSNSYVRKPVDFLQFSSCMEQLGFYWLVLNERPPERPPHE